MLMRKRERFERTDVYEPGPATNVIALAVLVAVFAFMAVLVSFLWRHAQAVSRLGDAGLQTSLSGQSITDPAEGYVASEDVITKVLLLTVDDANAENPQLQEAQILSLNATTRTGALGTLPLNTRVTVDGVDTTLADLYASQGAAACIVPLSTSTNLKLGHVIVATDALLGQIQSYRGAGVTSLVGSAAQMLETIKTDMTTSELMDVAELVQSIGVDNLTRFDVVAYEEDDGSGTVRSTVDQIQLGLAVGTIVAAE